MYLGLADKFVQGDELPWGNAKYVTWALTVYIYNIYILGCGWCPFFLSIYIYLYTVNAHVTYLAFPQGNSSPWTNLSARPKYIIT